MSTDTVTSRTTMTDGISTFDIIAGVHVQRIHPVVIVEPADSPATFPQPLADTQSHVLHVMHGGVALAVTVAIRLVTPTPVGTVED